MSIDDPWLTESSTYAHQGPHFSLRLDRVSLSDDRSIDGYLVVEAAPWVTVVALTDGRELVLVRQYRHALGRVSLELPGGACDVSEDPIVAGQRELREETGCGGGVWHQMLTVAPNPALQDNWDHFVLATGVVRLGEPSPDDTEDLLVELRPHESISELISSGEIFHALHVAALLVYEKGIAP